MDWRVTDKMIAIVAAVTKKGVIGRNGKLPWDIHEEMALFKKTTLGKTVIMGRKTFESTGALGSRKNIVVSRRLREARGAEVCSNINKAISLAESYGKDIFIIGGAQIFRHTIADADKIYLSYIKKDYPGDAYFPRWSRKGWRIERRTDHKEFEQVVYRRAGK